MRATLLGVLLVLAAATPVAAQVQVDVRLEKDRYLAGEPIVVVVDVRNVGAEAVSYSCGGDVRLAVMSVERRVPPNIFGCFSGTSGFGLGGCTGDRPSLPAGQATSFRYLLRDYDLRPGGYDLRASGAVAVSALGASLDQTLALNVEPATEEQLQVALAPLVSDVAGRDLLRRYQARAAIIEAAPPFLAELISRFAAENSLDQSAIEALGRIATPEARTYLKNLFTTSSDPRRAAALMAIARIGHPDDAEFLASVLQDATVDQASKQYAALGLGRIGGDQSVRYLERALSESPPEHLSFMATALGNTRSRAAAPILIDMYRNPTKDAACRALQTLIHRDWCDSSGNDPAGQRRRAHRWWYENGSTTPIYGQDDCAAEPLRRADPAAAPVVEPPRKIRRPAISALQPRVAAPDTSVAISGSALEAEDSRLTRVLFTQGNVEHPTTIRASGGSEYIEVIVPQEITPGRWQLIVDVNGRRSAPARLDIIEAPEPVLTGISPVRPHPAQTVFLATATPSQATDQVELVDARGARWRLEIGATARFTFVTLPEEIADGKATVRMARNRNGVDTFSAPFSVSITSDPLPLDIEAVASMTPVAAGQWTELGRGPNTEFEMTRVDRVDVSFRQGDRALISQATGLYTVHVQVPPGLATGAVEVRTRTWIEQTASDWSAPATFRVVKRPVAAITEIDAATLPRTPVWWEGRGSPKHIQVKPGEALILNGHFPATRAGDLRVELRRRGEALNLSVSEDDEHLRIEIPAQTPRGDYKLVVSTTDRAVPQQQFIIRVM